MTDKRYTIKEIADELGVSKQAVHQKRKSAELSSRLQSFTSTVNGIVYISEEGVTLLRQAFDASARKQLDVNEAPSAASTDKLLSVLESTIEVLRGELFEKNEQLRQKDMQIAELQEQNSALTAAVTAAQMLHAGTMQKQLADGKKRRKWRFWEKENEHGE